MNTKEQILDNQKLEDGYYWVRYVDDEKPNWVILALRANKWCVPGTWQHMHTPDIISERILSPAETAPSLPYVGWVEIDIKERLPEEEGRYWVVYQNTPQSNIIHLSVYFRDGVFSTTFYDPKCITHWLEKTTTQYPVPSMVRDREIAGLSTEEQLKHAFSKLTPYEQALIYDCHLNQIRRNDNYTI